jgi:uncharacterized protein (DUF362 family)
MDPVERSEVSRRDVLKVTGAAALAAALAELLPGSFLLRIARAQEVPDAVVHLASVDKGAQYAAVKEKIRASLQATRDLSVIKPGDLVVIKVVSNSPYPYPMVTHPWALQAVIEIVKEHGANVRVVDQVGFEHCFFTGDDSVSKAGQDLWKQFAPRALISGDQQVSSGMEALQRNGLKKVAEDSGAQVFSGDTDADYFQVPDPNDPQFGKASDPEFAHWTPWTDIQGKQHPQGFRVNKHALELTNGKPPHVISISRISAHIWAGSTIAVKAYYGWIHPQDRVRSHTDVDPVSESPVLVGGKPVTLPHPEIRYQAERIAEVAAFFQNYLKRSDRYYANLVVALDTYSDVGPDWGVQPIPGGKGVIAASNDAFAADAATTAMLVNWIRETPQAQREAAARKERWNVKDLFTAAGRDRVENAWQSVNYSQTRGLWNTYFGAVPFLQAIDPKTADPSVWTVGQIKAGLDMGMAHNMKIQSVDGTQLTPAEQKLIANEPNTPGMLKKLDESKGAR